MFKQSKTNLNSFILKVKGMNGDASTKRVYLEDICYDSLDHSTKVNNPKKRLS